MEISGQLMAAERYGGESTPTIKEKWKSVGSNCGFFLS